MKPDQTPDFHGAKVVLLSFLTAISFAWIGLTGVAFLSNLLLSSSFDAAVTTVLGGGACFFMGLTGGFLVDKEALARLPKRRLWGRIGIASFLCIAFPLGCNYAGEAKYMNEEELEQFYTTHRAELAELVRLHQVDPTLSLSKYQGAWYEPKGRAKSIEQATKVADGLPGIVDFSSTAGGGEIVITLNFVDEGFFDMTRQGIVYQPKPDPNDKPSPPGKTFRQIEIYDQRVIKPLQGNWKMFSWRITD